MNIVFTETIVSIKLLINVVAHFQVQYKKYNSQKLSNLSGDSLSTILGKHYYYKPALLITTNIHK